MRHPSRLKRRLIQQAVEDNLATMYGRPGRRRHPWSHHLLTTVRILFFLAVPAALFASTYVMATAAGTWGRAPGATSVEAVAAVPQPADSRPIEVVSPDRMPERVPVPRPIDPGILPLSLRTVVIDPGHGGENEGTRSPDGLIEKEVTLDIARRLEDLLRVAGYEVVLTRAEDRGLSLRARAEIANRSRGDIFVSIHVNWLPNRRLRGLETFYLGPTEDPELEALAARENLQSGYSLADLRDILHQVYAGVRQEESRHLAEHVQSSLFESLHKVNDGVRDRGVKSAPFGVLTRTDMPAILAEVSSVSNDVESRLLMTPIYRQYLAEALYRGIESYSRSLSRASDLDG